MTRKQMTVGLVALCGSLLAAAPARAQTQAFDSVYLGAAGCTYTAKAGSPEGVFVGKVCDEYKNTTTGEIFRKLSGAGNTGWIGPSALTKTDDTNVTLTLGGSAATSLQNPASLTLGWTGTLAYGRGGCGAWSQTTNGVVYAGASACQSTSAGPTNSVLTASGGAPSFSATPTVTSLFATANVGVGTVSTNYPIVISKSSIPGWQLLDSTTGTSSSSGLTVALVSGDAFFNQRENKASVFLTNNTEAFRVDNAQNLGTSTYASQTTGWRMTTSGALDVRYLFTDELRARIFTADKESVLKGALRVTKSYSTISQTFTCPASGGNTTLWVFDDDTFGNAAVFSSTVDDTVIIHSMSRTVFGPFSITECIGVVNNYTDGTGGNEGQQAWLFTRGTGVPGNGGSMTASTTVAVNNLVQDMGVTTNGYAEIVANDGSDNANAPYFQIPTWVTSPTAANTTVRLRLGQLNGITSTSEYGFLAGSFSGNAFVRLSDQNAEIRGIPLNLYSSSTKVISLNPNGTSPYISLGNPTPTAFSDFGTVAGIFLQYSSATSKARMYMWADANNYLKYDGSVLLWKAANTALDASGNLTAASATLSGAITATSGSITGAFTIGTGGSLASGASAYGTGTGFWADYNGGSPRFRVGNPSGDRWDWSSSTLTVVSDTVTINPGITIAAPPASNTLNYGYKFASAFSGTNFNGVFANEPTSTARFLTLFNTTTASGKVVSSALSASSNGTGGSLQVVADTTGTPTAYIQTPLNVGIGLGAAPTHLLQLGSDDAAKPTTATWTIVSDASAKTNIVPDAGALDLLRRVQIRQYDYTGEYGTVAGHGIGPIAQEIAPLFPRSVSTVMRSRAPGEPQEAILVFNPHEMWMATTQGVIELDRELEQFKIDTAREIDQLKADIAILKKKGQ